MRTWAIVALAILLVGCGRRPQPQPVPIPPVPVPVVTPAPPPSEEDVILVPADGCPAEVTPCPPGFWVRRALIASGEVEMDTSLCVMIQMPDRGPGPLGIIEYPLQEYCRGVRAVQIVRKHRTFTPVPWEPAEVEKRIVYSLRP